MPQFFIRARTGSEQSPGAAELGKPSQGIDALLGYGSRAAPEETMNRLRFGQTAAWPSERACLIAKYRLWIGV